MADEDFDEANQVVHSDEDNWTTRPRNSDNSKSRKKHEQLNRKRLARVHKAATQELAVGEFVDEIEPAFSANAFHTLATATETGTAAAQPRTYRLQVEQCVSNPRCVFKLSDGHYEAEVQCREAVTALLMPPPRSIIDVRGLRYNAEQNVWSIISFVTARSAIDEPELPAAGIAVAAWSERRRAQPVSPASPKAKRRLDMQVGSDSKRPTPSNGHAAVSMMAPPSADGSAAAPATATTPVSRVDSLQRVPSDIADNTTIPAAFRQFQEQRRTTGGASTRAAALPSSPAPPPQDAKTEYLRTLPLPHMPPALAHHELPALGDRTPPGQFYIGPVHVDSIMPAPIGTKRPTRVLVSDIDGVALEMVTWSSIDDVQAKFDADSVCWIGRGIVEKARVGTNGQRFGASDYQVKFSVGDSRNANELLIIEPVRDVFAKRFMALRTGGGGGAAAPSATAAVPQRSTVPPLSVSELIALRDGHSIAQETHNVAVVGMLMRVSANQPFRNGQGFLRRVTLEDGSGSVQLNVFNSLLQFQQHLSDWCGADCEYDARHSGGDQAPRIVTVRPLTIRHQHKYKLNLDNTATIEECVVDGGGSGDGAPTASVAALTHAAQTLSSVPVMSLNQAHSQPANTRFSCYVLAPYCADLRHSTTSSGAPMHRWPVSVMDDSASCGGGGATGNGRFACFTVRFFQNSPIATRVRASGPEQRPALDQSPSATGSVLCAPPENVVVVKLCNYYFSQGKASAGGTVVSASGRSFEPNKYLSSDAQSNELCNPRNDERAAQLRKWFIDEGHRHFVPSVQPEFNMSDYRASRLAYDAQAARFAGGSAGRPLGDEAAAQRLLAETEKANADAAAELADLMA